MRERKVLCVASFEVGRAGGSVGRPSTGDVEEDDEAFLSDRSTEFASTTHKSQLPRKGRHPSLLEQTGVSTSLDRREATTRIREEKNRRTQHGKPGSQSEKPLAWR